MRYVLDASAVLALLNEEPGAEDVSEMLSDAAISAVNLAEVGTKLVDAGMTVSAVAEAISLLELPVLAFDAISAEATLALREATRLHGLSLGDRACLALAVSESSIAVTADRAWAALDVPCPIQLIR